MASRLAVVRFGVSRDVRYTSCLELTEFEFDREELVVVFSDECKTN
jgi:hypothetical protein